MSKSKFSPEQLEIIARVDDETGKIRGVSLLFTKNKEETEIKLKMRMVNMLADCLTDLTHNQKMLEVCEGYRILDK